MSAVASIRDSTESTVATVVSATESTVLSILVDIDADVDSNALEACHRFGKPERTTKSRKTMVRFTNRKCCKKALLNGKN